MIKLELAFGSLQEAADFLAKHAPTTTKETNKSPAPAPAPNVGKSEGAAGKASSTAAPAAAALSAAKSEPAATQAPAAPPTYEKSGLPEKIAKAVGKDRAGVVALLGEFGAKRGGDLKPEQFADFGAKIDALLAGGESLA